MTAVSDRPQVDTDSPAPTPPWRRHEVLPLLFVAANAIAFLIIRPGVNDLWAARARESAAQHGVGLDYWFSWFSGGSTPGNYSVLTPYVSALIGAEMLGVVSAVAIMAGAWTLLYRAAPRAAAHPLAALAIAAIGTCANLWSGRIPFLFGTAFAVWCYAAVARRRTVAAIVLGVLSVFCSPVSGAFIGLALVGTFLSEHTREYRRICLITTGSVGVAMILVAVAFGNPGPENFSIWLTLEILGGLALCLFAAPAPWVRSTVWLSMLVVVGLFLIPNGLGSNIMRWGWFYVPVAVMATSQRRVRAALVAIALMTGAGVQATIADLANSANPSSTVAFYQPLAHELDTLHNLSTYRLEVVASGSHAGDEVLLNHAMLARGWESQEDQSLNAVLASPQLTTVAFKIWLDNNAVGYVAIPQQTVRNSPEYALVAGGTASYLTEIWHNVDWRLFRVTTPTPIVQTPATVVATGQARMELEIPCRCAIELRLRYSKFLVAHDVVPTTSGTPTATVANDGSGYSVITTTEPGRYYLEGNLSGLFH